MAHGKNKLLKEVRGLLPEGVHLRLRAPGRGAGPGPRGAVRAPPRGRRALRGDPRRRPDRREGAGHEADDRRSTRSAARSVLAVQNVEREETGVLRHRVRRAADGEGSRGSTASSRSPSPTMRRRRSAVVGRYMLSPRIFHYLAEPAPRRGPRDPAHRRHRPAAARRGRARLRVRGHALRLRQQAGLPAGHGRVRAEAPELADDFRAFLDAIGQGRARKSEPARRAEAPRRGRPALLRRRGAHAPWRAWRRRSPRA